MMDNINTNTNMNKKYTIYSGGQNGTDIGALTIAKELHFQTGGWLPKGCWTLDGAKPEYINLFNMKECEVFGYKERTRRNARDSDCTIRFATNFNSAGEKCTLNAIKEFNRPYLDIKVPLNLEFDLDKLSIEFYKLALFIKDYTIVNIAGNSEKTSPGIEMWVRKFLLETFKLL